MEGEVKKLVEQYKIGKTAHPLNVEEIATQFKSFQITSDWQKEVGVGCDFLLETVFNREKIIGQISGLFFDDDLRSCAPG